VVNVDDFVFISWQGQEKFSPKGAIKLDFEVRSSLGLENRSTLVVFLDRRHSSF
jgi:hypothetical protein